MTNNALMDVDFLKALTENRERTVYARVVALDMNEIPMDEISGRVTQGSITIDGTSSVRRSFSLSMVANEVNINDYYWGLHSKIQLYIGLENKVDKNYPDVIWFKQGIFVISGFNTAQSVNSYTISMQGKDKMCMLNGELGGVIKSLSADFDYVEIQSTDNDGHRVITKEKVPVKDIIREVVHAYGNEPLSNIIVNDLDEYGLELLEFRGEYLYFLIDTETDEVVNMITNGSKTYTKWVDGKPHSVVKLYESDKITYDPRMSVNMVPGDEPTVVRVDGDNTGAFYTIARIEYGETCGYRLTDLTYPSALTGKVGEPITTAVLDKIKNMLGNFEYFYDVDGHFIFQRKKTYLKKPFSTIDREGISDIYLKVVVTPSSYVPGIFYKKVNGQYIPSMGDYDAATAYYERVDGAYTTSAADSSPISYYFGDSNLVTSFNNSPNLANLKNDFSIWGSRKSAVSDKKIPIHLRYAIDEKPEAYVTYDGLHKYTTKSKEEVLEDLTNKYQLQKTPNPNGLPEEWWDVHEWAEFYRLRTGAYPTKNIGVYCTSTRLKIWDYFKKGNNAGAYWWAGDEVLTDDVFYYTATNEVVEVHGTCAHPYTYYTLKAQNGIGAYIHNPEIPDAVIKEVGKDSVFDNNMEIHSTLDWREVIYQMALDYNLHGHKDDFAITILNNNPDLCRNNGTTGYETYYQDLVGFWRTLYNPFTGQISENIPDHDKTYYEWSSELQNFVEVPFQQVAKLNNVTNSTPSLLYVNTGNTYAPVHKYISTQKYYKKLDNIVLNDIVEDKLYYWEIGGNMFKFQSSAGNSKFIRGFKYYEDRGYKRAKQLEIGKEYYKRTGSDGEYTYTLALTTDIHTDYFTQDAGLAGAGVDYVRAMQFSQDGVYYTYDYTTGDFVEFFTYNSDDVFYEKLGFVLVADLETDCGKVDEDLYYYFDPEAAGQTPVRITSDLFPTGVTIFHYHKQNNSNVVNGKYYQYIGDEFLPMLIEVFKSFEYFKEYYRKTGTNNYERYNVYTFRRTDLYDDHTYNPDTGWSLTLTKDPADLDFWFDFLESTGDIAKYAVRVVGDRSKAVNDDNVKSIYYRETPCVIFVNPDEWNSIYRKPGYTYIQLTPEMANMFHISARGKTAHDQLEEFLYNFTYCTESISMTTVPVYHLQPNTRISVSDQNSHIEGEYLVTRLTMPLTYNGTMNISATKAVDTIY